MRAELTSYLSNKHSSFSTTFPIYLYTQRTEYVPDEEAEAEAAAEKVEAEADVDVDEDEAVVEEVTEEVEKKEPKTKAVLVDDWVQMNSQPPIWMRLVSRNARFRLGTECRLQRPQDYHGRGVRELLPGDVQGLPEALGMDPLLR